MRELSGPGPRRGAPARRGATPAGGGPPVRGEAARRVAADALGRIEEDGAYANLVLPAVLERSGLDERDRAFVTSLVYGTTRMRRACDFVVDRFLARPPAAEARTWLRLGAYQLTFGAVPAHAAVSATVGAAPKRLKGLLNAVLRRAAAEPPRWPSEAVRLSYPDWMVARLVADLGDGAALAALEAMDEPAAATRRPDGYVQDLASQWVAELVGARPGERVLDAAAAPGGKATAMAAAGATVVAADVRPARAGLVQRNAARLGLEVATVVADGRRPPFAPGSFARVLLDAPCSGLGTLRRRADARWRITEADVGELAELQDDLLDGVLPLVAPGGSLTYSVCTLTHAETVAVAERFLARRPGLEVLEPPPGPWRAWGPGALLLPQDEGTDGMFVCRVRVPGPR